MAYSHCMADYTTNRILWFSGVDRVCVTHCGKLVVTSSHLPKNVDKQKEVIAPYSIPIQQYTNACNLQFGVTSLDGAVLRRHCFDFFFNYLSKCPSDKLVTIGSFITPLCRVFFAIEINSSCKDNFGWPLLYLKLLHIQIFWRNFPCREILQSLSADFSVSRFVCSEKEATPPANNKVLYYCYIS